MANWYAEIVKDSGKYRVYFVDMVRGQHHPQGFPLSISKWAHGGRFAPHWRSIWNADRPRSALAESLIAEATA